MTDASRLEDLRRRIQKDPASIAFAQLAEEYRRAGMLKEAVDACRAGLAIHPGYLSARVTLGRALAELNDLDAAQQEFDVVLKSAPENLAAIRGLAEIHRRRGALGEALTQYRTALTLVPSDPGLEIAVDRLSREVAPVQAPSAPPAAPRMAPPPPPADKRPGLDKVNESLTRDTNPERLRATRTIAALEQWLAAVHVARPQPHA